jgi:hypothetical protein
MLPFYVVWRIFVEDESVLVMLVQQYANKHGITFSSKHLDDEGKKAQLITLIQESLSGKRGPVTDEDLV